MDESLLFKNVTFCGFTQKELCEIKKHIKPTEEVNQDTMGICADVVGCDVALLIRPRESLALVKL